MSTSTVEKDVEIYLKLITNDVRDLEFYDKEGNSITYLKFWKLKNDPNYPRVDRTIIGNLIICTSWLGVNHGSNDTLPEIFETLIFDSSRTPLKDSMRRYTSLDKAIIGHKEIVQMVLIGMFRDEKQGDRITN